MTVGENAKEIESLKAKVAALENENASLKKVNEGVMERLKKIEDSMLHQQEARKRADIEKTKLSVIIKGVSIHKDVAKDGTETKKQTNESVKNLLSALDIENSIGFYDAIRFKPSEKNKTKGPELVKLTVSSVKHKAKLYEALSKSKGKKKIPKVSVTDEIPVFLREKQATLEKTAFDIRTKVKTTKTRIFFKGTNLVLKVKKIGETMFSEVSDEGNPIPKKKQS